MTEMQLIAQSIKNRLGEGVKLCPDCKLIIDVDPKCYSDGSYGPSESPGNEYHCQCDYKKKKQGEKYGMPNER